MEVETLTLHHVSHVLHKQELLNDLLDSLHEDSNKVVKKPYVEGLEDKWVETNDLSRVGEESWRRYVYSNIWLEPFCLSSDTLIFLPSASYDEIAQSLLILEWVKFLIA